MSEVLRSRIQVVKDLIGRIPQGDLFHPAESSELDSKGDVVIRQIEPSLSQTLLRLWSPPFFASPPQIKFPELLAASARNAMQATWSRHYFDQRPVTIYRLDNVYIAEEGLVFDSDGQLYTPTITQHSQLEIQRGHAQVRDAIRAGSAAPTPPMALCVKRGAGNYGHWLAEMLPLAFYINRMLGNEISEYIVPSFAGLRATIGTSLSLCGIAPDKMAPLSSGVRFCSSLHILTGLTSHGTYMSPLVVSALTEIGSHIKASDASKIFVSRRGSPTRRLIGEEAIEAEFGARGFVVVEPGVLPFTDQVSIFKGASVLAGVAGAAMSNIVFCPSGASASLFYPFNMPDTFFWFLALHSKLRFQDWRCLGHGAEEQGSPWDSQILLDMTAMHELLNATV